ncbi:LysE family translocator [Desulfofustis glycolicus]|uniref:Threonine/homoserine/homoserine lactone efflux protein n=1 Tax=Desulfofustis glycolicus DSM 9705 TaxID=1121409 RepID=A0A1M5SMN1_9BACT|nr:LysE family translocator [Desulfofustis glycolicus]SHH39772.1 Threonine/homoserine/homoserine lactone efflux protein [Desulfofustis glycolicus DSM 9705]
MEFILIATAHFLALLSPGPDFFLILQASLRMPKRYGIAICCGIATANSVYLLLAVLGLEVVKEINWLMTILRYSGSCYLIYIGILLLRAPRQPLSSHTGDHPLQRPHFGYQVGVGFLSGILNPKNMIFYLSLFTAMVSPETGLATRCLYALWMTSIVFIWDSFIVILMTRTGVKSFLGRRVYLLEKASGMMLATLGTALALS